MTDPIARLNAALEGRYEIVREIGEGGMATVYLARDVKHNRQVAIKVLKAELAAVIGGERFLHEIETTAALQHPNILPLFDSGEADSFLYYVMPFVDGETLRARLEREKQLGVEEAIGIAAEVAGALDYAHRQGVIHRDIKPANILLHDGRPLVADFGIALAVSAAGGGRLTETGLSLGTPHYMSPEQATADRDLTARSDVYSLASVLYEMLAGEPPHTAPTAQAVVAKILTEEPKRVTDGRKSVPGHVAAALSKALEKLPADRFTTAAEFADALRDPSFAYGVSTDRGRRATSPSRAVGGFGLAGWLVAAAVAAGAFWLTRDVPSPVDPASFTFDLDRDGSGSGTIAVADDGTVILAEGDERQGNILVRRPDALDFERIHRDQRQISSLSTSPDGQWVAFTTFGDEEAGLYKIPMAGGPAVSLIEGSNASVRSGLTPFAAVWSDDGWIYFRTGVHLARVPANGGAVDTFRTDFALRPFDALPRGRGLLLSGQGRLVALDFESGDTVTVVTPGGPARWAESGHVVYTDGSGSITALPFSLRDFAVTGPALTLMDSVASSPWFDLSRNGTLVYPRGAAGVSRYGSQEYWWQSLDGEGERIPIEAMGHTDGELSPDGRRLAYTRNGRVHVFDLDLGTDIEIGPGHHDPVWSPDGREIAVRNDTRDGVWAAPADGSGEPREIVPLAATSPRQWLADGTLLLGSFSGDVWTVPAGGGEPPRDVLVARWQELSPEISPDEARIAYVSNEDGVYRAYVRSWPDLEGRRLVSEADTVIGSAHAIEWSSNSGALYYITHDRNVVLVELGPGGEGPTTNRRVVGTLGAALLQDGDLERNRLLVTRSALGADDPNLLPTPNRLVVVTNWLARLRERP